MCVCVSVFKKQFLLARLPLQITRRTLWNWRASMANVQGWRNWIGRTVYQV